MTNEVTTEASSAPVGQQLMDRETVTLEQATQRIQDAVTDLDRRREAEYDSWVSRVAPSVKQVDIFKGRVKGGKSYLMSDNRASGGQLEECATATCAHCGTVVILRGGATLKLMPWVKPRQRERGYCRKCHAYICDRPGCRVECHSQAETMYLIGKYPDKNIPLLRSKEGNILYDPLLSEKEKIY